MKKDIVIVGAGIVGLMSAYSLCESGRKITIIDKNDITDGSSFGNAGLLSSFGKNPLSAPGVLFDTLKLMLKGESPVNLHPGLDINLYKWLVSFALNSTKSRLKKTLLLFERYGQISLDMYSKMTKEDELDFHFCQDGLLMVYTEQKNFDKKAALCTNTSKYEILSKVKTKEYMPFVNDKIAGSILLKQNGHLDPDLLMRELKKYLLSKGVEIIINEKVEHIEHSESKITKIRTKKAVYEADTFIFSTGADDTLSRKLKNNFLMTPAKGYSITFEMEENLKPKTCSLFADLFIAMTPRKDTVRMTSKLELGTSNEKIVKKQIDSIHKNLALYSNAFEIKNSVEWTGFRPLTPNDMPLIGFDDKYSNLVHATGLGWLGITFGPAVGKIVSDLVIRDKSNKNNLDVQLFSGFYQG
ncbi:MAG: FAD-binding oxidoreductase [Campylobacteraceae bacterium]|nr:FAD-binding oxidoreductase [Campylobacteraceae bacterium]